ncbi:MAG: N-acetylmuramoyl-L-alanine amidase [Planctomycetes bacterium]|nr:N-acetylmuramoyl-L-alanine amidase [Planctomycetota bacterium]
MNSRICRFTGMFLFCAAAVLGGCGDEEEPPPPPPAPLPTTGPFAAPTYANYLKGMKICLDPGHGGRANRKGYKRGPTGLREAEVNLKVAHCLREFLEASGAKVYMTRRKDVYLAEDEREDQRLRIEMANRNDCDVFVSIHHNASGTNPNANFTSVWYHDDPDHSPASLDVAQQLAVALTDELRLPQQLGCPLMSDKLMFAKSGFSVLRQAKVPAVLCESSFHSNPDEEARLRNPEYNRREAHALFAGLARYAYAGIPRMQVVDPPDGLLPESGGKQVVIELNDGIRDRKSWGWDRPLILSDSIVVRQDGKDLPFTFDKRTNLLTVPLPKKLKLGSMGLEVRFMNLFKQSNPKTSLELKVVKKLPPNRPVARALTPPVPAPATEESE